MRLGFHYHDPARRVNGQILMSGPQGRFIESLAVFCDEVVCFLHTPRPQHRDLFTHVVTSSNVRLMEVGPHVSVPERMLYARQFTRPLQQELAELDVLLLRGPSPLLPAMAAAAGSLPVVLLLVGDYVAEVDKLPQPRWRKELIRIWARWNLRQQQQVAQRSLTFVNSHRLFEQYQSRTSHLRQTQTTTLSADDFYEREDTCGQAPYRLLYTGRLAHSKGLFEVIEALSLLRARGLPVVLDLVGWSDEARTVEALRELTRQRGVAPYVQFHGFKQIGPELFSYYRQADVYVFGSLAEGFPRAIWEALAHSLPVVATCVGGIPFVLQDRKTARLVAPGDAAAMAGAVEEVLGDGVLRRGLIREGLTLAKQNTLNRVAADMVDQIRDWICTSPPTGDGKG